MKSFSREENEETIEYFIKNHPEFSVNSIHRIWPHKEKGEGHFAAVLEKEGYGGEYTPEIKPEKLDKQMQKLYEEFVEETLNISFSGKMVMFGENLYLLPKNAPDLKGIKVLRPGLHVGSFKKKRFEPAHALSHALKVNECKNVLNLSLAETETLEYLKGETLCREAGTKGWYLVCVENIPMGFAKYSNGMFKNHYPKGLRVL